MQKNPHTRAVITKIALPIIIFVTGIDIAAKYIANRWLPEYGSHSVFDVFLFKNTGIAFSIPAPQALVIVLSIGLIITLGLYAVKQWNKRPMPFVGAVAVIAGALSNLVDRLINGYTTDYLIFFQRSAINLADILIIFGVFLILYYAESKEN